MNTPYYSIRQPTPGPFNTIIIQPHFLQWVINQLPLMLIVVAGVLLCGMDSIMFKGVLIILTVFSRDMKVNLGSFLYIKKKGYVLWKEVL